MTTARDVGLCPQTSRAVRHVSLARRGQNAGHDVLRVECRWAHRTGGQDLASGDESALPDPAVDELAGARWRRRASWCSTQVGQSRTGVSHGGLRWRLHGQDVEGLSAGRQFVLGFAAPAVQARADGGVGDLLTGGDGGASSGSLGPTNSKSPRAVDDVADAGDNVVRSSAAWSAFSHRDSAMRCW